MRSALPVLALLGLVAFPAGCRPVDPSDLPERGDTTPAGDDDGSTSETPDASPTPPMTPPVTPATPSPEPEVSPTPASSPSPTPLPVDEDGDGYSPDEDCDDANPAVHPGRAEVCDGVDQDCDGTADDGLSYSDFFADGDGDGYGDPSDTLEACAQPDGYVNNQLDCDDSDVAIHPGTAETCDGVDQDCDGSIDEGVTTAYYPDSDQDGYGDGEATPTLACAPPASLVVDGTDCDDRDDAVHPARVDQATGSLEGDGSVASPYLRIQDAVDAPGNCSLVEVGPGTYAEAVSLDASHSGLTLRSTDGAGATSIEVGGSIRPLTINGVIGLEVSGFTVRAKDTVEDHGAGIRIDDSSGVRLEHITVRESYTDSSYGGGGMAIVSSDDVTLVSSTLESNAAEFGGGMLVASSTVTLSLCTLQGNTARDSGGGLWLRAVDDETPVGTVTVEDSELIGNTAAVDGGGLGATQGGNLYLRDSMLQSNVAVSEYGGGVYNPTSVERCTFIENQATGDSIFADGGGAFLRQNATVSNSIFMGNLASYAGAIDLVEFSGQTSTYKIVNNTFVDNVATEMLGEHFYVFTGDSLTFRNNIVYDVGGDNFIAVYNLVPELAWVIEYSDFSVDAGSALGGFGGVSDSLIGKYGNLGADPLFTSYSPGDYAGADLHLAMGSPCIDSGATVVGNDPDGSMPDMGAYGGPGATW